MPLIHVPYQPSQIEEIGPYIEVKGVKARSNRCGKTSYGEPEHSNIPAQNAIMARLNP